MPRKKLRDVGLNLPRAPLSTKTGGFHRRKDKVLDRKRKHKGKVDE